jgi:hypothetical protein
MILTSRLIVRLSCLAVSWILVADAALPQARAQDSAPSSHLVFDDTFDGDILINEVRVPKSGEATYTYYEALGWRGRGAGYAGIQAHPKSHLFIFSIWDHKEHTAPIRAVHRGPGTETVGFGGEGTGLKSWNFELGWQTDVWYTLVARSWPVGDHTHFGFWSRAGDTGKWTHLVTMDVAAKANFQGGTDAFIEDWLNTGAKRRTTHLRGGWKRKLDGTWFPFGSGRYSVNTWDLEPGKRSFNYRTNWNGGTARDETGEFYFMVSGGADTQSEAANPSKFAIARTDKEPSFAPLKLSSAKCELADDAKSVALSWEVDESSAPQFGIEIRLFDHADGRGSALAELSIKEPHARSATLTIPPLDGSAGRRYFVSFQPIDLLDRRPPAKLLELPVTRGK